MGGRADPLPLRSGRVKTELRFEEKRRKQQDRTQITFVTADKQEIVVPFYKETERGTSAYIKVSKVTMVNDVR